MDSSENRSSIPFARRLRPDRQPKRLDLRLGDGYRTGVLLHAAGTAGRRLPVLCVHGIQSHPGWFVASADVLAMAGRDVFQVMRRGSGDNIAARGHARSAGLLCDDIRTACRFVLDRTGAARLHLLGVSWGGKLLTAYALRAADSETIASLTLVAPGIEPLVDVSAATKIAVVLSLLAAPRRRFEIPLNDVELFTDNLAMRSYLRADALRLKWATARFLYASHRLDAVLKRSEAGRLGVPTTLLLARDDRIIDNAATRREILRLTDGRATIRELPGCHTLEFAEDPSALYAALAAAMRDE